MKLHLLTLLLSTNIKRIIDMAKEATGKKQIRLSRAVEETILKLNELDEKALGRNVTYSETLEKRLQKPKP